MPGLSWPGRRSTFSATATGGFTGVSRGREWIRDQGDPLSPFLFALAIAAPLDRVRSRLQAAAEAAGLDTAAIHVFLSYLDDVLLGVPPGLAAQAFTSAQKELAAVGLRLNREKCEARSPASPAPDAIRDRHVRCGGAHLPQPSQGATLEAATQRVHEMVQSMLRAHLADRVASQRLQRRP